MKRTLALMLVGLSLLAQDVSTQSQTPTQQSPQTAMTVRWSLSPSTNVVSQTIGWGTAHGNYNQVMNLAPNVVTFQITGMIPATTYFVSVRCTQALGAYPTNMVTSDWGPELVVTSYPTSKPTPPGMPVLVSQP